jgi:DNA invertase Pin-like site-specific DNA recombinase
VKIGYVSVEKREQTQARQLHVLRQFQVERIFKDRLRGADPVRMQRLAMLDYIRPGDVVYVESLNRLAPNSIDFQNIFEQLKAKDVGLVSIREDIDTTNPAGRLLATIFAVTAQFE